MRNMLIMLGQRSDLNRVFTHLNTVFSETAYKNIITNGQFYLCLLVILGIFAGAALYVKNVDQLN
jgi:hypothetical protein